jgi:(+)-trans-carveol dehydrogenase
MGRVEGKVALVTGAASGQGRSHALRLAEEGADIIAVDVCERVSPMYEGATEEDLAQTVKLVEEFDRRIIAAKADVRDYSALKAAVDAGVAEFGKLDVVVANAGILTFANGWELTEEAWDQVIDINLKGTWQTLKAATPHLIAGGRGGSIVLTSSNAGIKGLYNMAHYSASKHGVEGLMKVFAVELAEHFIRVNTICPTAVDTHMIQNKGMYQAFRPELDDPDVEDCKQGLIDINLLPIPWIEPVDVSNAVLYLASDESRYVTGLSMAVDAGSLIR